MIWSVFLLALLGLLLVPPNSSQPGNRLSDRLLQFRAGSLATLYPTTFSSLSGFFSWNPETLNWGSIKVYGNTRLALLFPPNAAAFLAPSTGFLVATELSEAWSLEAGASVHTWLQQPVGAYLGASLGFKYTFERQRLGLLNDVVLGYTVLAQGVPIHEFSLAVGFKL